MHRLNLALCLAVLALAAACDHAATKPQPAPVATPAPLAQSYAPATTPLMILDRALPVAFTGQAYSHQMTAIGGTGTYYWTVSGAGSGLVSLSSSGVLTAPGIPSHSLGTGLTFRVQDSVGRVVYRSINFHANYSYNHPNPGVRGRVLVLHHGEQMSYRNAGQTNSRFQRAVQHLMQDVAELTWDPVETNLCEQFVLVTAGNDAAVRESAGVRTAQVSDKVAVINALAALVPGGDAPMYAAMQLAETAAGAFTACDVLALYSGGSFGADAAAPGGQANFSNVLAHAGGWVGNVSMTWALDFAPAGTHRQFMQDFAVLTWGGLYAAP